jgi:citronellyl-CoA dehydrogenase
VLRHRLVDWITDIECLKHLTYHIVRMKMEGLDVTREVSMGKLLAGQLGFNVANGCLQMFGGMGYMNESLITRNFRDSRLISIGGGADEIMKEIIARLEGF